MTLRLNAQQLEWVMTKREVFDDETKSRTMQRLVELELYRDTGDARPFFCLTNKGEQVRNALFELQDLGMLS